jgi:hypothetical protein
MEMKPGRPYWKKRHRHNHSREEKYSLENGFMSIHAIANTVFNVSMLSCTKNNTSMFFLVVISELLDIHFLQKSK